MTAKKKLSIKNLFFEGTKMTFWQKKFFYFIFLSLFGISNFSFASKNEFISHLNQFKNNPNKTKKEISLKVRQKKHHLFNNYLKQKIKSKDKKERKLSRELQDFIKNENKLIRAQKSKTFIKTNKKRIFSFV